MITSLNNALAASHLLFSPEFIEHVLDLQFPVLLQAVEGVLRHLFLHLLLQGRQLGQDGAEIGSAVGVLVPALCHTHSRHGSTYHYYAGDSIKHECNAFRTLMRK